VVSEDGAIVTDRIVTDDCLALTIPGYGNADRVAEDKEHDLALLRIYGARGLKPLNIQSGATKTALDITGIADPQSQGGGAAASTVKASIAQAGVDTALSPPPAIGFSGAAALDTDGKFAGIALLKPVLVAGPANAAPAAQATLVSANTVRDFLKSRDVTAADGSSDAKAAVRPAGRGRSPSPTAKPWPPARAASFLCHSSRPQAQWPTGSASWRACDRALSDRPTTPLRRV